MHRLIVAVFAVALALASVSAVPATAAGSSPAASTLVVQANEGDDLPSSITATKGDTIVLVRSSSGAHGQIEAEARSRVGQTTFVVRKVSNRDDLQGVAPKDRVEFSFLATRPGHARLIVRRQESDGWHLEHVDIVVK